MSGPSGEGETGWYRLPSGGLEQGDVLWDFPLVIPFEADGALKVASKLATVVILTQSCDIPKPSQRTLLLSQVLDYSDACEDPNQSHLIGKSYQEQLARGQTIADFLLPPAAHGILRYSIVSFRNLYVLPKQYVENKSTADQRLSLRSPYREYLAQSYARFMMRVGLPEGLEDFPEAAKRLNLGKRGRA